MIPVRKVRDLTLDVPRGEKRPPHVSAASSLVQHKRHLFVVADDEVTLCVFPVDTSEHGYPVKILEGGLPEDAGDRKEAKPDLETVILMPPFGRNEHGALLALGSGSSDKRDRGVLVPLQKDGLPTRTHTEIQLKPLYDLLREELEELNIEGAAIVGDVLRLLQRGNGESGTNARIDLDLQEVVKALAGGTRFPASAVRDIVQCDLGRLHGVELCFSDASSLPDGRMVFGASAESSGSARSDGKTVGSAIGIMERDGTIEMKEPIDVEVKLEGLSARAEGDAIHLLMVTDADDPSVPSPLLAAEL